MRYTERSATLTITTDITENITSTTIVIRQPTDRSNSTMPRGSMERAGVEVIHWVCNSPSPYNDHLFQSLHDSLPKQICFHFTKAASSIYFWQFHASPDISSRCYRRRLGVDWHLVNEIFR